MSIMAKGSEKKDGMKNCSQEIVTHKRLKRKKQWDQSPTEQWMYINNFS